MTKEAVVTVNGLEPLAPALPVPPLAPGAPGTLMVPGVGEQVLQQPIGGGTACIYEMAFLMFMLFTTELLASLAIWV